MKRLITFLLLTTAAFAQSVPYPPANLSRVAGRFVAYNYGLWKIGIATGNTATGSQTIKVQIATVNLGDGRQIQPFSTNAPLLIGKEVVTPSAVSGCVLGNTSVGACSITATFAQVHAGTGDLVSSGTAGLQEALNDTINTGGVVTVDSAWAGNGGTSGMIAAAVIPGNGSIEDVRTSTTATSFPSGANLLVSNSPANAPQTLPNASYDSAESRLNYGKTTDFNNSTYLLVGLYASSIALLPGFPFTQSIVSISNDGINWESIASNYIDPGSSRQLFRDPTIWKVGTRYWVSYMEGSQNAALGLAYSEDLVHWTFAQYIAISGTNPMGNNTWAPEAFVRNPGCTGATGVDNNGNACTAAEAFYLFYASQSDGTTTHHQIYAIKASDRTMLNWGNDAGSGEMQQTSISAFGTTYSPIDPQVIQIRHHLLSLR